jgi:hypothetical protein
MSRMQFNPVSPRKSIVSSHPKSVFDRETSRSKSGITLARHRDQSAYRTAKSRKLRALHGSTVWQKLSESQRHDAEAEIVAALQQQFEERMATHTLEWRRLVESGEVSDDADMIDETAEPEGAEESEAWITDSESEREGEGKDDDAAETEPNVYDMTAFTKDFMEIKESAGKAWLEKMQPFENKAEAEEKKWRHMSDQ